MIASKKVANNIMKWNNVQQDSGSEPTVLAPVEITKPVSYSPSLH